MNEQSIKHQNQSSMFYEQTVGPIIEMFKGLIDHLFFKLFTLILGIGGMLSLDLFSTPSAWWKALTYLVLLDWVSGIIVSMAEGKYSWQIMPKKAYKITGYIICCSGAALVANAMPEIFYYAQFAIYAAFFAAEFYSILRMWRVWALFMAVVKIVFSGKKYFNRFEDLTEAIEHEHEKRFSKNHKKEE